MKLPSTCNECGGRVAAGFIVDQAYGSEQVSTWQKGEPQKRLWTLGGIAPAGAERIDVTTLRCEQWGLLRNYAPGD